MLGIHKSYNGEAATIYFKEGLSREGRYYLNDTLNVVWHGKTAQYLGLHGKEISSEDFSALVHNKNPKTGKRLTVRDAQNRRAGFDLTFSAVKSVSVVHALTKDENILKAHKKAYQAAMSEIEQNMQTQANIGDERFYEATGNIIYGAFDHFTSRPCEVTKKDKTLYISDPQLHTHCYMPNVTWNPHKQRYQALEIGNIHRLAPYYEAVYHAHLSHELKKAGYTIKRTAERYEIQGITPEIIQKFSNRSELIEQVAAEKGVTDPVKKAELGVTTRHSKAKAVSEKELYSYWQERLSPNELAALHQLKEKTFATPPPITVKEAVDQALAHFLERNSVVQEKRLLAYALTLGYGQLLPKDVAQELHTRDTILRSKQDTVSYITTREMVWEENKLINDTVAGKGMFPALHPEYQPKQVFLNEGQRKAIATLLTSKDQFTLLKGAAGVGKTSLLTEVRDAVSEVDKSLFAFAPSSQAVSVLNKEGFEAHTIAALLHNPKLQEQLYNNVLLVDEAGMCGVKTLSQIVALAKKYEARCVLSGDTRQHSSPEYGDAMRLLETHAGLRTATIQKIMRQKPVAYKAAVQQLAQGKTIEGYHMLDKMNAIKEIPEHEERLHKIASDYVQSVTNNRSALIVSPTNYEGRLLNQAVREQLKAKGSIQGKEKQFEILQNLSFTEAQKKDAVNYESGQIVRFVKNQKGGFKAGNHYEVIVGNNREMRLKDMQSGQTFPLPCQTPEQYQVYQRSQAFLAKGDSIRLTNNNKTLEGTKVTNGSTYEVKGFSKDGIQLTNGKTLSNDIRHWKYAYADTSHAAQGKTCQDVFISMSDLSFSATNQASLYVAASRAKQSVTIYTSDKEELKKAVTKSAERMTAMEVAKQHTPSIINKRMQRQHYKDIQANKQKAVKKNMHPDKTPENLPYKGLDKSR